MTDPRDEPRRSGPIDGAPRDRSESAAYLEGDERIFRELDGWIRAQIRTRYPALLDEEEDIVQTVHGKLLVNLREGKFRHASTLRSYVYAIINYTAIDRLRIRYRDRALAEAWEPRSTTDRENPYSTIETRDDDRLLRQVVMGLPANCLQLWRMVFVERLRYETIAERLAVPVGTVKSRMWLCRKKATAMLRALRDGGDTRDH